MRILLWAASYPPDPGGVGVVVRALARSLTAHGHVVQVVTQSVDDEGASDVEPEAVVHRLPFHQTLWSRDAARLVSLTSRVAEIKRDFQPHVLHAHAIHPSEFFLLRTSDVAPCPTIFTLHGWTPMTAGPDTLRERMLRAADRVTGCSRYVVERALRDVPETRARALTIYNGLEDPRLPIAPLPYDPPKLLCVGRLVESKGFDRVLRALPALLASHPDLRLTIVGDGADREALERECAERSLTTCTEFAGEVSRDRVFAYLNTATMLVVPSRAAEGFPMVVLEAAAMERPVVATDDGGMREAVLDGQTGFLVESGDQSGLENAVWRLLENPDLAARLGRAGRRRVLDHFDWQTQVTQYAELYADVDRNAGRDVEPLKNDPKYS